MIKKLEGVLGHNITDIGGLAFGGAVFGVINTATEKYLPTVSGYMKKVPVIGDALPVLILGALVNYLGSRSKGKAGRVLEVLGGGIVGAGVIRIGVNVGNMVIPQAAAVAGLTYIPNDARSGDEAYLADRNYAQTLGGIKYLPGAQNDAGMGASPDFGEYAQMGDEGQMG